jgi:protein-disulfide isomerase
MAKKPIQSKKQARAQSGTNWLVVGGIVLVGVIGLFALLYLTTRETEAQPLADYCAAAPQRCVAIGDEAAPVTFVEVSDFGCPHCQDFHLEKADAIKENFVDTGDVRWVFLPYALRPETAPAAAAAMCAAEQDKYLEFANAMFAADDLTTSLTRDGILAAGATAGLDAEAFQACVADGRYDSTIDVNQQAASAAGVSGTPTFFVNNQVIRGNVPLAEFENQFRAAAGS